MTKEQITQILIDNSEHILDYLDNDRIAVEKEDFSDVADAILKLCEVSQQRELLPCKHKWHTDKNNVTYCNTCLIIKPRKTRQQWLTEYDKQSANLKTQNK